MSRKTKATLPWASAFESSKFSSVLLRTAEGDSESPEASLASPLKINKEPCLLSPHAATQPEQGQGSVLACDILNITWFVC